MLKMSFREKVVALVLIILVIVLIFVMGPIKMIRNNIETDEKKKEKIQVEYDDIQRKIKSIPTYENNITKVYNESKDLSKPFSLHKENFQIDEYVQGVLNKDNDYIKDGKPIMEVYGTFKQDDFEAEELEFYCYVPEVVSYPILENADVNGNMLEKTNPELHEKVENSVTIASLTPQSVERHQAAFGAKFTKEGLYKFMDQLRKDDPGMRIVELVINDYKFGNVTPEVLELDPALKKWEGYSVGAIAIEFYTMQQIQEPVFD